MLDRDRASAKARETESSGPVPRERGLAQTLTHAQVAVSPDANRDVAAAVI
jgi:hypothetical protein